MALALTKPQARKLYVSCFWAQKLVLGQLELLPYLWQTTPEISRGKEGLNQMTNSTKLTDLNRANEALPAKNVRCHHQNINPEQLCYVCKGENDVVDSLGSVHLEVDVEAIDIEALAAETHKIYCEAYEKRFGKPFWTNGDYSKLDEPTKEYDRHFVRWAIKRFLVDYNKWARMVRK